MHKEISKKNEKNLMLVWTCLETQKKKRERERERERERKWGKEIGNVTM